MDFELDDEQLELQRVVRDIVERECTPALVRAVVDGSDDGRGLWKTFVQLDWPSLTVPADDGGMGMSAVELVIALEELGRVADPTPFLATTSQYVPVVRECTDGDRRTHLLGAVCAGATGAVALAGDGVRACRDGDEWVLDGSARHVVDGDRADSLAVVGTSDEGVGVFVVPAREVAATRALTFDGAFHLADVALDGVRVDDDRAFVGPGVADGVDRARQEAVAGLAAVTVGASQRVLEIVLAHIRDRKQFGVPIGAFQAVKHMAVDMYVAIERARALCHFAGLTLAEDDDRRALAASLAKAAAGDCQRLVARHGVQLFGGLGPGPASGSGSCSTPAGWCRGTRPSTGDGTPRCSRCSCTRRSWAAATSTPATTRRGSRSSHRRSWCSAPRSRSAGGRCRSCGPRSPRPWA